MPLQYDSRHSPPRSFLPPFSLTFCSLAPLSPPEVEIMFGRVRASYCSPDNLERRPSKILKDDSLSIYEATLVRLKLGSQRVLSSTLKDAEDVETSLEISSSGQGSTKIEAYFTSTSISEDSQKGMTEEMMAIDSECSSNSNYSGNLDSKDSPNLPGRKNVTVLYLFSKFKSSQHSPSCVEAIAAEDEHSAAVSPESSSCEFASD